MRILATGGGGQVGTELARRAAGAGVELTALTRAELDITQPDQIRAAIDRHAPDVMINPAAYTAVDKAEDDAETAFAVNRDAPALIAEECAARAIPLIHVSTDYVFDGSKSDAYVETDPVHHRGIEPEEHGGGDPDH